MSKASQNEQRQRLLDLQQELENRVEAIRRDLGSGRSRDSEDQAQERENDDVLDGLLLDARKELQSIGQALEKLDAGTYGECHICGARIDPRRLESIPYAVYCISCAEQA